eukprot:GHVT01026323.1.p2 GENE.GHVT01026323.1~~GHVT01026323.1.p2  ORF type:complete len:121 (-),score=11.13 GHVT01026323.1:1279-1641(-)
MARPPTAVDAHMGKWPDRLRQSTHTWVNGSAAYGGSGLLGFPVLNWRAVMVSRAAVRCAVRDRQSSRRPVLRLLSASSPAPRFWAYHLLNLELHLRPVRSSLAVSSRRALRTSARSPRGE